MADFEDHVVVFSILFLCFRFLSLHAQLRQSFFLLMRTAQISKAVLSNMMSTLRKRQSVLSLYSLELIKVKRELLSCILMVVSKFFNSLSVERSPLDKLSCEFLMLRGLRMSFPTLDKKSSSSRNLFIYFFLFFFFLFNS